LVFAFITSERLGKVSKTSKNKKDDIMGRDKTEKTRQFVCENCGSFEYEPLYGQRNNKIVYGGKNPPCPVLFYFCSNCSKVICIDMKKFLSKSLKTT
jgi:hypothetical protein